MMKKITLIFVLLLSFQSYSQEIKSYTWDEKPTFKEIPDEYKNQPAVVLLDKRWIHTRVGGYAFATFGMNHFAIKINKAEEINKYNNPTIQIQTQTQLFYNPELKSVFTFVPGVMTIILMLVSAMMTSISITKEKEMGTMEVLLVSPIRPFQVIIGKVFPYVFLSIINALVILLLGFFVFKMPMEGSYILLAFVSVLFIVTALSLGILISTISNSQQTAMMISLVGLMLPVIILSGFIFPVSSMPLPLQIISNIIPAKWFIIILKAIMLKGAGLFIIWKEILILIGMTVFFIILSIKKYKIRLE